MDAIDEPVDLVDMGAIGDFAAVVTQEEAVASQFLVGHQHRAAGLLVGFG